MEIVALIFVLGLIIGFLPFWVSLGAGPGAASHKVFAFVLCLIANTVVWAFWPLGLLWWIAWVPAVSAYGAARRQRDQAKMLEATLIIANRQYTIPPHQ